MPELQPFSMPPDAFEKAEAKTKSIDFYADLTDEERAEEDLPPRAKAETPPPSPAPEPEPEPEPEPDEDEDSDANLFEDIDRLDKDIAARLGDEPKAGSEEEMDPLLKAALEDDNPVLAELARREVDRAKREREALIDRQQRQDDIEFSKVQEAYGFSDGQMKQIENYMLQNPEAARILKIEEVARRVYPEASKTTPKPGSPPRAPGSPNGAPPVATIVESDSASASPADVAFKPRPNETIESAIAEAGRRLFPSLRR